MNKFAPKPLVKNVFNRVTFITIFDTEPDAMRVAEKSLKGLTVADVIAVWVSTPRSGSDGNEDVKKGTFKMVILPKQKCVFDTVTNTH